MGEYTDYPADYAEVSTFQSGQQSPAPYATTTLIGSSKLGANDARRFNMFYTTEAYPPNPAAAAGSAMPNQSNYNRSVHSESYCNRHNNSNKVNIVENRMANTMVPNMFNHQQQQQQQQQLQAGAKIGTNKRNRLKLMRPQNFRINFGSQGEQLYVKVGDLNSQGQPLTTQHTPQSQNGSINWSQHSYNIYENQLHNQGNDDAQESSNGGKEYIYAGNRSVMSYMSSKDFPENV